VSTGLDSSNSTHIDVEEYGLMVKHPKARQGILSIARLRYVEAETPKGGAQTASKPGVVFYNQ
jgi:hypothetical protein